MKKTYIIPNVRIWNITGGNVCKGMIVGSGNTDATSGDGTVLTKEDWWDDEDY